MSTEIWSAAKKHYIIVKHVKLTRNATIGIIIKNVWRKCMWNSSPENNEKGKSFTVINYKVYKRILKINDNWKVLTVWMCRHNHRTTNLKKIKVGIHRLGTKKEKKKHDYHTETCDTKNNPINTTFLLNIKILKYNWNIPINFNFSIFLLL